MNNMETSNNIAYLYDTKSLNITHKGFFSGTILLIGRRESIEEILLKYLSRIENKTIISDDWVDDEYYFQLSMELFADLLGGNNRVKLILNISEALYVKFILFTELFIYSASNVSNADKVKYINLIYNQIGKDVIRDIPNIDKKSIQEELLKLQQINKSNSEFFNYINEALNNLDENYDLLIKLQKRDSDYLIQYNYIQMIPILNQSHTQNAFDIIISSPECINHIIKASRSFTESNSIKSTDKLMSILENNEDNKVKQLVQFIGCNILKILEYINNTDNEKLLPENIKYMFLFIWGIFQEKDSLWLAHENLYIKAKNIIESLKNELL